MSSRAQVQGRAAGRQLDSLRRSNASAVLSELRASGSLSRSDIASNVGLSPAAITKIIGVLERAGYIVQAEESKALGRRDP
jgi:DNA-binding MarR family transcriptional regulator